VGEELGEGERSIIKKHDVSEGCLRGAPAPLLKVFPLSKQIKQWVTSLTRLERGTKGVRYIIRKV
jgi:hypothetical protein